MKKTSSQNEPKNCPHCKTSLIGEPIPQEYLDKGYYPESSTHYKREIGIDGGYLGIYDGIVAFQCPDCHKTWPRSSSKWAIDLYSKFIGTRNKI
jgi:transposase-like protein